MKKALIILLAVCMLWAAVGCTALGGANAPTEPERKTFLVPGYNLQIMADDTYSEKTGGSFDLQLTNNSAYISVMAYNYSDLDEGTTARDLYDFHNEDITSKRDAVNTVEETYAFTLPQAEVIHGVFTAEKEGNKNYYASYLFDFPEKETVAWVLVTAIPSYYENNKEHLNNMACSLAPME